jgi:hypothetical protein
MTKPAGAFTDDSVDVADDGVLVVSLIRVEHDGLVDRVSGARRLDLVEDHLTVGTAPQAPR